MQKKHQKHRLLLTQSSGLLKPLLFKTNFMANIFDSIANVLSRAVLETEVLDAEVLNDGEDRKIEVEKCTCEKDLDIDSMIGLIYFLRDKQSYRTYKERFFDFGDEFISDIRIATDKKISDSRTEISKYVAQLNQIFEKFNINTCLRKTHFLAQSYLETASFRSTFENRTSVPNNYMGGVDFQGRGMKQITHDYNYLAYYDYINNTNFFKSVYQKFKVKKDFDGVKRYESVGEFIASNPKATENGMDDVFYTNLKSFAKKLAEDLYSAFDSAGWYISIYTDGLSYMDNDDVEGLTKVINGGNKNISERKNYTAWLKEYFGYTTNCK